MDQPPIPVRRKDRIMGQEQAASLLKRGEYCFLATSGADGRPYGVPLSYVLLDGAIYFHCAAKGRKLDNIRQNSLVCLSVVDGVRAFAYRGETKFSTQYESVFIEGAAAEVVDKEEKIRALVALVEKYTPESAKNAQASAASALSYTAVVKIIPELTTAKKREFEDN